MLRHRGAPLIEVDGESMLRDRAGDLAQMELYAYAMDPEGSVYDFAAKNVGLDLKEVTPLLEQGGFKFMGHLDLPPGDFTLRVLARNSHTGRYSLRSVPITVPAFDEDEPLLLPPMFPDLQGKWLLSREDEATRRDVPYPSRSAAGSTFPQRGRSCRVREASQSTCRGTTSLSRNSTSSSSAG
ncbi:MAG: hypothetical protein GY856_54155 [bacterium]|nr:hypothetical protein [bacterium]